MERRKKGFYVLPILVCLFLVIGAGALSAQGLSPSTPAKEFIHFNGQVVAVENFKQIPTGTYSISGRVTSSGSGLSNVTISLDGGRTTITDVNGIYSFTQLNAGYFDVAAAAAGYQFLPQTSVAVLSSATPAVTNNFVASISSGAASGPLQFVPLPPCRLVDTRGTTPVGAHQTQNFQIGGGCNIPTSAAAYSLSVTVLPASTLGYLTIWPYQQTQPLVATLNSYDGRTVANAAILQAGSNGIVSVYATDQTNVLIDTNGYFVTEGSVLGALDFFILPQCGVVNTQNGSGTFGGPSLTAQATRAFPLPSGSCNLPTGASAYSLNVTAIPPASLGWITVWPEGQSQPGVSTLNAYNAQEVSNAALVPSGTGGVNVFASDMTNLLLDVNGYFLPSGSTAATPPLVFIAVPPCRLVDTRNEVGALGGPSLAAGQTRTFPLQDSNACPVPEDATALSVNATVIPKGSLNNLALWAADQAQPSLSTLHALSGQIVNNAAIVATADDGSGISAYASDSTDLVLDLNGYFVEDQAIPVLQINPNPINSGGTGVGTATLTWNAAGHSIVSLRVGSATGSLVTTGGTSGSAVTGNWVTSAMTFVLVDTSSGMTIASAVATVR